MLTNRTSYILLLLFENKCVVGFRYELFVSDEGNMETSLEERMLFQGRLLAML